MTHIKRHIATLLTLCLAPLTVEAASYRWIDSNGRVHYSQSVPASDAQGGHIELRKNGIYKKVVLSAEKNRARVAMLEEQKEQRKLAAKLKKEKAKQEEEEIRLLSIFSSEDEVINSYNAKLRMSQLTIDLLKSRHQKQSKRLESLERKLEQTKNIDHKQTYANQIDVAIDNLSIYQQAITENLLEKDRVKKEYKATLNKFKRLMAKTLGIKK